MSLICGGVEKKGKNFFLICHATDQRQKKKRKKKDKSRKPLHICIGPTIRFGRESWLLVEANSVLVLSSINVKMSV